MATTANLMVLSRAYRGAADKALADYGLSQATAWPVILAGRLGDGVRQGALAEALGVEGPSLVRVLDQLQAAGYVHRLAHADRRAKTLHLTAAGRQVVAEVEQVATATRQRLLAGVAPPELARAHAVVSRLAQSLDQALAAAAPRP